MVGHLLVVIDLPVGHGPHDLTDGIFGEVSGKSIRQLGVYLHAYKYQKAN